VGKLRVNSKGQVTIPADIRKRAGLLPGTEVEAEFDGTALHLTRSHTQGKQNRGARVVAHLRRHGGDVQMSTDEIMALTRAADWPG
jgi:AbrB family looped-hinge helix DNA binding protein